MSNAFVGGEDSALAIAQEQLAREFVRLVLSPLTMFGEWSAEREFTLADLLDMATMMLGSMNEQVLDWVKKDSNRRFLNRVHSALHNPEQLQEFVRDSLQQGTESFENLQQSLAIIKPLVADRDAAVRFFNRVMAESLPKTKPGRPTRFRRDRDAKQFLSLSARLLPLCLALADLEKRFPEKPVEQIIGFVAGQSPDDYRLMIQHCGHVDRVTKSREFKKSKGHHSKAQRLADALAGIELFGWSASYSSEQGKELRRLARSTKK